MWSSEQDISTTNRNPRNHTFGSSSSTSRSSLSSNSSMVFPQTPRRSMEDVLKDISLMTPLQNQYHQTHHLQQHYHHQNIHHGQHQNNFHLCDQHQTNFNISDRSNPSSFKGIILHHFLAGPLNQPLSISTPIDHNPTVLPPIPATNLPPTSLSLNSGIDFSYLSNTPSSNSSSSRATGRATETSLMSPAFPDMMMDPPSPGNIFSFCSKKRFPDGPTTGGDRRQKRMMKNRESAARSRARKQSHASELEQNVHVLTQENEMLHKQCEELRHAMERQLSTRHSLQRCGSSPF